MRRNESCCLVSEPAHTILVPPHSKRDLRKLRLGITVDDISEMDLKIFEAVEPKPTGSKALRESSKKTHGNELISRSAPASLGRFNG